MKPILTKYERVRVLGTRATQISHGAPSMIDITNMTDAFTIAERELEQRVIPLIIIRTLPNGKTIEIPISDFQ
jgi:DNA-directed RNA polymerases I, II, and III subunit RPABC2